MTGRVIPLHETVSNHVIYAA